MNRITGSLPAKIAAVFLITAAFVLLAGSGLGVGYLYSEGYYGDSDSYYESQSCVNTAHYMSFDVARQFAGIVVDDEWLQWYTRERTNLAFEIVRTSDPDTVLARNYVPDAAGYRAEAEWEGYTVRYAVSDPLTADDSFRANHAAYRILYPMRWHLIGACAAGAVSFLALLAFLMCAAGRRRHTEETVLRMADRIPLDLYAAGAFAIVGFLAFLAFDNPVFGSAIEFILVGSAAVAAFLVLLCLLMTVTVRVKAGRWWRNTLAFILLRFVWRILLAVGRNVPLAWKTAAVLAAAALVQTVLSVVAFDGYGTEGIALLLLFGFDLALLAAACRVSVDMQRLRKAAVRLASGETGPVAETSKLFGEFRRHGENLNRIGDGMNRAVELRMKSERLKTELITNVSHDIKTPLTSIVSYVDLLKKEGLEGQSAEYLEVLDRQSQRLRKLTDDLVEASKASTGNLPVALVATDLREVVSQAVGEYAERLEAARLDPVVSVPETGALVMADGRLMWRVLDNLLGNALKYSLPGTRIYIEVRETGGETVFSIKNISAVPLNVEASELMERFVRGDTARSTEGSGLGLNIARSLLELQHARFALVVDGDLFKAEIRFSKV